MLKYIGSLKKESRGKTNEMVMKREKNLQNFNFALRERQINLIVFLSQFTLTLRIVINASKHSKWGLYGDEKERERDKERKSSLVNIFDTFLVYIITNKIL